MMSHRDQIDSCGRRAAIVACERMEIAFVSNDSDKSVKCLMGLQTDLPDFLPPPGLRTRAVGVVVADRASSSFIPRLIVFGEIRSAVLTMVIPPRPKRMASAAAQCRRSSSLKLRLAWRNLS